MIPTTLVLGSNNASRELAIEKRLEPNIRTAVLLEGIPGVTALQSGEDLDIVRMVAGCPCCDGNLTLRVMLNRMLRKRPARLYIGVATADHVEQLRAFLGTPPYDTLLTLTQDIQA